MIQEWRSYVLASRTAVTTSTQETVFVGLSRPVEASRFLLVITSASGTIKATIQSGFKRAGTATVGLPCQEPDPQWFDWASGPSLSTAGVSIIPTIQTNSNTTAIVSTTGNISPNSFIGGPNGVFFRAATALSGTGPTFSYEIIGEFAF